MERDAHGAPPRSRLTRVLAVLGRGALFMAGGAGVLWIGALPPPRLAAGGGRRGDRSG